MHFSIAIEKFPSIAFGHVVLFHGDMNCKAFMSVNLFFVDILSQNGDDFK